MCSNELPPQTIASRFRGFLPVVIDVETGGFNPETDALLECAVVIVKMNDDGYLYRGETYFEHIIPFEGANLEKSALDFNGIIPDHPLRLAKPEDTALKNLLSPIRQEQKRTECTRSVLVGHNAQFDLSFMNAAVKRTQIKRNPLHPFAIFDTATLAGLAYGQTVLARALQAANIAYDSKEAHSAVYDAERTAELFCQIVNEWKNLGGWK